jgi:hypothetical protein
MIPNLKVRRASLSLPKQRTFGFPLENANMQMIVAKERKQCTKATTKLVFLSIGIAIAQWKRKYCNKRVATSQKVRARSILRDPLSKWGEDSC